MGETGKCVVVVVVTVVCALASTARAVTATTTLKSIMCFVNKERRERELLERRAGWAPLYMLLAFISSLFSDALYLK